MSEADKMFKDLGYVFYETDTQIVYLYNDVIMGERFEYEILFAKPCKTVFLHGKKGLSLKELAAISLKLKELDWSDFNERSR